MFDYSNMRQVRNYILFIVLTVLLAACTGKNPPVREPQPSDALYTEEAAMSVYDHDPERALLILDSAEMVGNLTAERASLVRAKVFSYNYEGELLDSAQRICMTLWNGDYVKNDANREEVLDLLVSISRKKNDIELWLRWSREKADFCRKQNDEVETLRTEAEIGVILSLLGRTDEGLAKLDEVIEQLDGIGSVNRLDASIVAMRRKINVLNTNGRPEEIIPIANRIIEKLNHYERHPDQYANDSYRLLPDSADRADYINFCRAQAYGYLADAYAHDPALADSTRRYFALFEQSDYGHSLAGRVAIAPTWIATGEYAKALAVYDELTVLMGADTVNGDYATMLRGRAIAADATGDTRAASDFWRRYATLKQLLNDQLQQSEAHEYAARYRAYEQQMEIERHREAVRRATLIGMAIGIIGFLILLFAIYAVWQWRKTKQRNRILAQQITEAVEYKDKYKELSTDSKLSTLNSQLSTDPKLSTLNTKLSTISDADLFAYLRDLIESEKLYLNPNFERQTLIDRTGLSKERIGAAFAQATGYERLTTLVRELRLDHAVRLLNEQPELTIEQVCQASGFANTVSFNRSFKAKFGMTPSEFRRTKA